MVECFVCSFRMQYAQAQTDRYTGGLKIATTQRRQGRRRQHSWTNDNCLKWLFPNAANQISECTIVARLYYICNSEFGKIGGMPFM